MRAVLNGVSYEYEVAGNGEPFLLLHGFTGSKSTWRRFLPSWSHELQVISVDILGHGETESPAAPERYEIEKVAADMVMLLDLLSVKKAHVLGYSMGGRLALTMAVRYPERVQSLVLENCTPGLIDEGEKVKRQEQDRQLARLILEKGVTAFVDHWEQIPLFASQKALPATVREAIRQQRLQNNPLGLANSLLGMGTGSQPSWWEELEVLSMPVLLLAGEYDTKFQSILQRMKEKLPNAQLVQISEAGHAIHVEQPEKFDTIVKGFLQTHFLKGGQ